MCSRPSVPGGRSNQLIPNASTPSIRLTKRPPPPGPAGSTSETFTTEWPISDATVVHPYAPDVIRGAFAAALTPLRDGGSRLDEDVFAPYAAWLAHGGVDGILALGTTGEGILLTPDERRRAAELFIAAARGRLAVAVHCGAQTTAETTGLAAHAAEAGADAVAVIAPPYFPLDEPALEAHLAAAAGACAPLPFYVYEFAARSGYTVPVSVVERLRERAGNLRGLKVSDKPWAQIEPYLLDGLDVFIGAESLIARGFAEGAAGAVSGLAAVFPEVVAALVREPTEARSEEAERLRAALDRFPFQAAAKVVAARRGVPIEPDVRAPLRRLSDDELAGLELP
jgi:dihydrodipicolinate synthase/N-acetylneuraminate lyase